VRRSRRCSGSRERLTEPHPDISSSGEHNLTLHTVPCDPLVAVVSYTALLNYGQYASHGGFILQSDISSSSLGVTKSLRLLERGFDDDTCPEMRDYDLRWRRERRTLSDTLDY